MINIKRYDEIMQDAIANFVARQDKVTDLNEGGVIHTILDTVSRLAEREYVAIRQGYNEMLSMVPYAIFGFERKGGTKAGGSVVFYRDAPIDSDTTIPTGTVLQGGGMQFVTTENAIISAGTIESEAVTAAAMEAGTAWNVGRHEIDTITSTVTMDVAGVRNDVPFTGGTDNETDEQFETRFKTYLAGLSGTNAYAIKQAALSLDGVRSVATQTHNPPFGGVFNISAYVEDGSGGAGDDVLAAVRNAIEGDGTDTNPGHLAPGIIARVCAPDKLLLDVEVEAIIENVDSDVAQNEINETIAGYVNGLGIGEAFIRAALVAKLMDLQYMKNVSIVAPASDRKVEISTILRLGNCTVSAAEEV